MATIDATDITDVLAKMNEGEFICLFIVKGGPTQGLDDLVTYPKDGTPMTEADTQTVLTGFLKQCPIPMDERENAEGNGWLNTDEDGEQVTLYSSLEWLATYIRDLVKGQASRGLKTTQAEQASNPMPD